ncbi:MAG: hypothetical protein KJ062_16350 [Thermoanaerobaculia bacterium]|nr:hypothetical protein [Thermoanaerobaculia bacterium]
MKRTTAAVLVAVVAIVFSATGLATMDMQKDMNAKYPTAKAKCISCHVKPMAKKGDAEVNAFGKDMMKFVVDPKAEKLQFDWAKLEPLDSDGDGVKNVDEFKAGTNPGAK